MFAGSLLSKREAEQNNQDIKNGEGKQQEELSQPTKTRTAL